MGEVKLLFATLEVEIGFDEYFEERTQAMEYIEVERD